MNDKLMKEIVQRKSTVIFSEKEVNNENIDLLIEAARWAPSCFNKQPWKYYFISKQSSVRAAVEEALNTGNSYAKKASHLVVVCADKDDACNVHGTEYYTYDCGLSVMSMVLQAEHLGLRMHQMAGFKPDIMKIALNISEKDEIFVTAALGYEEKEQEIINKTDLKLQERMKEERTRKPVSEKFFII